MRAWSRNDTSGSAGPRSSRNQAQGRTDLGLLYACIEPSLRSREFFLRKAIGWALRQYAWTDPREVLRYVRAKRSRLSGLTKREALKTLLKQGTIDGVP